MSFPYVLPSVAFPVEGCLEWAHTPGRLQDHFMHRHQKSQVVILQEGPSPMTRFPN